MIGKPIKYDEKYEGFNPIWKNLNLEIELKKYLTLLNGKNVLDLGIGEGKNSTILSKLGYNVTGVDYSLKALEICKNNCSDIKLIQDDIRNYDIEKDKYNFIMSRYVLHFLHKQDIYNIINNIKSNIKESGLVYISVFSVNDPGYSKKLDNCGFEILDNNIFHKISNDTYTSYFTKEEILQLFSDFKTISISDEYSMDLSHGEPHYHGVIKYIGKKVSGDK